MRENFIIELKKHFGHAATIGQQQLMQQLSDFILSEIQDELFVIKGYAGTGKTTLVSAVIKSLGTVKFFNESKGYGFIKDNETGKEIFVHVSGLIDKIDKEDPVEYEEENGKKGLNAINVKKV